MSAAYTQQVRDRIKTGFMRPGENGLPVVTPCEMVRLSHRRLEEWLGKSSPIFPAERSVNKKYDRWLNICKKLPE